MALLASLSAGMEILCPGDMQRAESMLYAQAHARQAVFMSLARRAVNHEDLKPREAYLRVPLKAQNQYPMTLLREQRDHLRKALE